MSLLTQPPSKCSLCQHLAGTLWKFPEKVPFSALLQRSCSDAGEGGKCAHQGLWAWWASWVSGTKGLDTVWWVRGAGCSGNEAPGSPSPPLQPPRPQEIERLSAFSLRPRAVRCCWCSGKGLCGEHPTAGRQLARREEALTHHLTLGRGFPGGKEPACQRRRCKRPGLDPWVGKIRWRSEWQPSPVFLPGESRGQRSLAGYSP